ncbi:MAG: ATP-grasp domain-containing protein [Chloroflexi bacterium]|nr:ATP-grasp domain-containing protein [Chloroflexota bacterium]
MFGSVLVANRGEIAVRVMRTCQRLGIRALAVYSEADRDALHVRLADDARLIGPPPAAQSYLDASAILAVAREMGAQAIHPGYGFLSENAAFARAVRAAGLVWIGPPPEAMEALGDKARARALAERIGVPVLPGYHGEEQSIERLGYEAERLGFPLLVKAAAGGGGRGMRVALDFSELANAVTASRREAEASFGDGRLLLERYVARPRHVEVQVIADSHGEVVVLGERECSIQRRHQKLIEESPSTAVDAALRARLGEIAVRLVREAGYENAGTIELLLDEQRDPYFLEVNARLQVEHPVTELVTRLDLVELQLRVAAGERLPVRQHGVSLHGHAIEARVIAEDPVSGFLPSSGRLDRFVVPQGSHVRVDTGVESGSEVPPYYDSLLAKVIAYGPDRASACERLVDALLHTEVEGVATNVDLILAVLNDPAFRAGDLATTFLAEHGVVESLAAPPPEVAAAAAVWLASEPRESLDPWTALRSWRVGGLSQPSRWLVGVAEVSVLLSRRPESNRGSLAVSVGGVELVAEALGRGRARLSRGAAHLEPIDADRALVSWDGRHYRVRLAPAPRGAAVDSRSAVSGGAGVLRAPMPGRIVHVAIKDGDTAYAGETLVVLEAMKMEHAVQATSSVQVVRVAVAVGDQVAAGAVLVELAADEAP